MRFAIFSGERTSLSWQARLADEGHDVLVYLDRKHKVGEGIVPLERNVGKWEDWAAEDPAHTVVLFDTSKNGERADRLRASGLHVLGAGTLCDRMEFDRRWALRLAQRLGIKVPPYEEFSRISDAIAFLKSKRGDAKWYFKANRDLGCSFTLGERPERLIPFLEYVREAKGDRIAHLLQAEVEGSAISTAGWWNGNAFVGPYEGTIEHKKLMHGDVGPALGCCFNVVWCYDEEMPEIVRRLQYDKLAEYLRTQDAPPGVYDINALVAKDDGEPYFLEFTPRLGYDSEMTFHRLIDPTHEDGELGLWLFGLASGTLREGPFVTDEAALTVRVSIPPVPNEQDDKVPWDGDPPLLGVDGLWEGHFIAYNVCREDEQYRVCDPIGIVGLSLAMGTDLEEMNDEALDYIREELFVPNAMYRTDAGEVLAKDVQVIRDAGYATATMLEVE